MTHGIDTSFRLRKQERAKMRRRARWRNALAGLGALLLIAATAALYLTRGYWSPEEYEGDLKSVEEADVMPPDAQVYVPAIVDLAGDPMWINLARENNADTRRRSVARPADLKDEGISAKVEYLSDTMLSSSERFMTAIPSSQEDFAFFEAQRGMQSDAPQVPAAGAEAPPPSAAETTDAGPDADISTDPGAGWGETIDEGEAALPDFQKTAIENNTTVATITPEEQRFQATDDIFVKVLTARSLESVATEAHFSAGEAKLANEALKSLFQLESLEPGYVVAMRGFRPRREAAMALMQISVYARNRFVGTLARSAAGQFVSGVDPWVRDDLFNYSGAPDTSGRKRQYRLLDAIYSTAARNNVPTGVLGEAIMYLSRGEDLNAFAAEDQRLVLLYSDTARGKDGLAGRVLYVGVRGGDKNLECFVFQQGDGEFACVTENDEVRSAVAASGMVTPVRGVMTSTFGPRMHPILKTVRIHKGVDWAAPVGTPIAAAFDGQVVFEGDGQGYGNLIRIAHSDNRETRYAHMQRFAPGISVGSTVKAGDIIGYVGTTGLSTGPHLHFELYRYGQVVDPLGAVTVVASSDPAVELLTDRIVHVESGGSSTAKNPLSSATGLGQFISSTWIRMMNTYRPDLARSLSTEELLALRYDPTVSREMVRNLAREGEAYLKARGHQITAGRLYLSHFLGMEGANQVLSAPGDAMLVDLLGVSVIRANPFLTGKNASYVIAWAERKMGTRVVASPTAPPAREIMQTSPEFEQYKQVIAATLTLADNTL